MYSLSELHGQLEAFREKLAEATQQANRAAELLDEAREAIVAGYAQAEPWVPPELDLAEERLGEDVERLLAAGELIDGYRARL
ncbi:MAG TPA: hypothetical protein VFG87_08265 [Amycolatopsis sp.]|jgi:hypothetical protein|nr:hypothetical protein [Amycolatopsis sp.]